MRFRGGGIGHRYMRQIEPWLDGTGWGMSWPSFGDREQGGGDGQGVGSSTMDTEGGGACGSNGGSSKRAENGVDSEGEGQDQEPPEEEGESADPEQPEEDDDLGDDDEVEGDKGKDAEPDSEAEAGDVSVESDEGEDLVFVSL